MNKSLNKKVIYDLLLKSGNDELIQINIESFIYKEKNEPLYEIYRRNVYKLRIEYNMINNDYDEYRREYIDEDDPDTKEELKNDIFLDMKRYHKEITVSSNEYDDDRFIILINILNSTYNKNK